MSIRLICVCGRSMALPEKYAGQHVQCPGCHAMLRIPTPEENLALTRWFCPCGQRLKARLRSAGRKVRCPKCSSEVSVPLLDEIPTLSEENFVLDDVSGIVQQVPEAPKRDRPAAGKSGLPHVEPPVRNLLLMSAQERSGPPSPTAPKTTLPPPDPQLVLDGDDDDVTRINPRGPTFLGEMGRMPAKAEPADTYEVAPATPPKPERVPKQQVRPAKPAAQTTPPPPAPAQVSEPEAYAQDVEEEGINSPELLSYFNTKSGIEAAKAAVMQVLNGYWLYVPYALLAACMARVTQLALGATEGNSIAAITWLALPSLFGIFLWAGFVACVKDGIFERSMGIERMFYNAGIHFLRFTVTSLLMVPIGILLAVAGALAIQTVWGPAPFLGRVGIVALAFAAGLFALELLLMPPVISVLEHRNAFSSLTRGLIFSLRHVWDLIVITAASMFLFWATVGVAVLFWSLAQPLLHFALSAWLFESLAQFVKGFISAAFMGQVVASLMLLYLSHVGDEEALQDIQSRLRGPAAVPMRLYMAIGAAAISLLALNYSGFEQPSAAGSGANTLPAVIKSSPAPTDPTAQP